MTDADVFRLVAKRIDSGRVGWNPEYGGYGTTASDLGVSVDQWTRMQGRLKAHKDVNNGTWGVEWTSDSSSERLLFCLFLALECEDES